jgi:hypothetical protein
MAAKYRSMARDSAGNGRLQFVAQTRLPPYVVEAQIANDDAIVDVGHRLPVEPALGEVLEQRAYRRSRLVYLADVMEADVPFKARSVESVRKPTGRVVTLEHQYSLACRFGEQRGRTQSADARANDNRVERCAVHEPFVGNDHIDGRARCMPHRCAERRTPQIRPRIRRREIVPTAAEFFVVCGRRREDSKAKLLTVWASALPIHRPRRI